MPQSPSTSLHASRLKEENDATATSATLDTAATPRSAFAWSSPPFLSEPTTAAASSASSPLPRSYRLHYDFVEGALKSKADTLDRSMYVFAYVLYVVGFCFYFLYDIDVSARYQLRHSLLDTLSRAEMPRLKSAQSFSEVASAQDYGEYVVYAVAPLLANALAPTGSSIPLGAMRVRTQRSVTNGCDAVPGDPATSLYTIIACADSSVSGQEDTEFAGTTRFDLEVLWSYQRCDEMSRLPFTHLRGALGSYHCGGFVFHAPLWVLRGVAANASSPALGTAEQAFPFAEGTLPFERISLRALQADYLRPLFWESSTPFLDNYATRMVVTEILFYSPPLHLFAAVKLLGEVTSAGSWRTTAQLRTAHVWTREDVGKGIFDAVVMLATLLWFAWFIARAVLFVRRREAERRCGDGPDGARRARDTTGLSYCSVVTVRFMATAEYVFDPLNFYTLCILCLLVTTAGFRIAAVVYSARWVPRLDTIIYQQVYPAQLEYLFSLERVQRHLNGMLVLLLFYRGLCFVTVDTQAARAVRVLAHAQSALCGYMWMSLMCTTTFSITLAALYGNSVWAFRNIDTAFNTLLRVMSRQHDISELTRDADNPTQMAFILFSFCLLVVVIILGLAASILVHGFSEIRKAEPSPVLAAYQIEWLLRRVWRCVSTPRLWPVFAWRWCTGYGDAALLRHAAHCLRGYRKAKYPALDHVEDELRQLVNANEFVEAMYYFGEAPPTTPPQSSRAASSGRRSSIWMVWTTRSTSATSSNTNQEAVPSSTGGGGGGSDASFPRNHASVPSGPGIATTNSSGSGASLELVKGRVPEGKAEEHREAARQAWQRRWGTYTPAEVWRDVSRDWLASTTSEAALHFREEVVWLRNGVQAAVGDNLSHAKEFPQRLAELERKLKLLESHFRENELTSSASEKVDREDRSEAAG